MQKKKIILTALIASIITIAGVIKYHSNAPSTDGDASWVKISAVKEMTLPLEAHAIGNLVARTVEITPEVAGHVQTILFKDGTFVEAGTPLIQLDDVVYRAQYESAKAKLAYSAGNFRRMTLLGKQGAIAKQAIDQADADFKERKADAEQSEVMVKKMKLMAPFAGVVGKSKVNPGDYVTIGQGLVTLIDTQHLHIEYSVPEKYLPSLKLGQEVKITTATYPGKTFTGVLAYISPTINAENRSVSLYAEVPNKDNELAAGMFVNVTQLLGNEEHVIMIPARSLVPMLDGDQVYKVVNGKAQSVNVVIGKRTEEYVQVLEGLSAGDVVITDGQIKVKSGEPVRLMN